MIRPFSFSPSVVHPVNVLLPSSSVHPSVRPSVVRLVVTVVLCLSVRRPSVVRPVVVTICLSVRRPSVVRPVVVIICLCVRPSFVPSLSSSYVRPSRPSHPIDESSPDRGEETFFESPSPSPIGTAMHAHHWRTVAMDGRLTSTTDRPRHTEPSYEVGRFAYTM